MSRWQLRLGLILLVLRHPWRALKAELIRLGLLRTPRTMWCPGCNYRTRRMPRVRRHLCDQLTRAGRRRLDRYSRRRGTVRV